MTSKLKCPVCGGDIQYNDGYSTYDCKNNPAIHNASEEIWQALIQAKQDLEDCQHNYSVKSEQHERGYAYATKTIKDLESKLEIARNALKRTDWCAQDYAIAQEALVKTTALTKGGNNE